MANNLQTIPQFNLPAEITNQFAALGITGDDLDSGVSSGFPVVSIRGAKWRISEGGEEHPIYIPGTTDLAPSIKVVLLRANPAVSKTLYLSKFEEGSDAAPDCYSNDGVVPAADAPKPQSQSCATCPHNVWGSKVTDAGKKTKACADVRRTAILPSEDLDYSPILLRIPAASLADLADYGRALKKRGIPYTAVVTKLSFDPDASYPKINFQFERVLDGEELLKVAEKIKEPVIDDILGLRGAVAPVPAQSPVPPVQPPVAPPPAEAPIQVQQPKAEEPKAEAKPATKKRGFGAPAAAPAEAKPDPAQQAAATAAAATTTVPPAGDLMASLEASLASVKF